MRALIAASVFTSAGCVPIDGGAVEFGWLIRDESGQGLSCEDARIAEVRLNDRDPGGEINAFDFDCDDKHGSTDFVLAEGRHLFTIEALTAPGRPAASVAVPNPISAQVRTGEVTDLQILVMRLP